MPSRIEEIREYLRNINNGKRDMTISVVELLRHLHYLITQIDRLIAENGKLRELLKELEWSSGLAAGTYGCGICDTESSYDKIPPSHKPDCELDAAIKKEK